MTTNTLAPELLRKMDAYRRANHQNLHVRGYKEEGTITTAFDMTVLNELDRFHLVLVLALPGVIPTWPHVWKILRGMCFSIIAVRKRRRS